MKKLLVNDDTTKMRIDKAIKILMPDYSRAYISKCIDEEKILLNGSPVKQSTITKLNDEITILDIEPKALEVTAENLNLDIIYEDEDVVAILDISQATKGHTLVLPKKHFANLLEIEDYEYLKVMNKAKDLASAITKAFNAKGVNILNNCGEAAGQTVMHFHVHIIPRYDANDVKIEFTSHDYNLDEIQKEILNNMN